MTAPQFAKLELTIAEKMKTLKERQGQGDLNLTDGITMIRGIVAEIPNNQSILPLLTGVSVEGLIGHH